MVADNLEREWNEKLLRLRQVQEDYERTSKADAADVSPEAKTRIQSLVTDLPKVWNDPRTPMRERKRMIRLLIEDITLVRAETIRVSIRWKGGATSSLELPVPKSAPILRKTPTAIVEKIRALATETSDAKIAGLLNRDFLKTGTGKSFTRLIVKSLRIIYNIPSFNAHLRRAGWLTAPQMAALLGVHLSTAKRFAREGVVRAVRSDDGGQMLFEPPTGPLPKAHGGKRYKDRRRFEKLAPKVKKEVQYAA